MTLWAWLLSLFTYWASEPGALDRELPRAVGAVTVAYASMQRPDAPQVEKGGQQ